MIVNNMFNILFLFVLEPMNLVVTFSTAADPGQSAPSENSFVPLARSQVLLMAHSRTPSSGIPAEAGIRDDEVRDDEEQNRGQVDGSSEPSTLLSSSGFLAAKKSSTSPSLAGAGSATPSVAPSTVISASEYRDCVAELSKRFGSRKWNMLSRKEKAKKLVDKIIARYQNKDGPLVRAQVAAECEAMLAEEGVTLAEVGLWDGIGAGLWDASVRDYGLGMFCLPHFFLPSSRGREGVKITFTARIWRWSRL